MEGADTLTDDEMCFPEDEDSDSSGDTDEDIPSGGEKST